MTEIAIARESESQFLAPDARQALNRAMSGTLADMELDPEPIFEKWILNGNPVARSKTLAFSPDNASKTAVWECTSGTFDWHYRQDEAVLIISGDAYLIEENGNEQRFAAGDFAFFRAGTVARWRVDHYIRKVAFLREPVWPFAVPLLKLWNKIMRHLKPGRRLGWTHIRAQR
jgi:uncharacterized cupin superfamily protein